MFDRPTMISAKVFQSHIGAIRIACGGYTEQCALHFNPTLVQLELFCGIVGTRIFFNFNPTLVQLELKHGTTMNTNINHFNPTLVQLESAMAKDIQFVITISIPHWCN